MAVFSDVICAHDGKFYTWKDFVNHCGIFFGQFAFCCHGIRNLLSTIVHVCERLCFCALAQSLSAYRGCPVDQGHFVVTIDDVFASRYFCARRAITPHNCDWTLVKLQKLSLRPHTRHFDIYSISL